MCVYDNPSNRIWSRNKNNRRAYNKEKVEAYKEQKVEEIINTSPEAKWNEETEVVNEFPLYDIDYVINGYVYEFKNGDKETGFIQIDCSTEEYIVDAYSFGGKHTVSILNETLENQTTLNSKNIYLGGYTYLREKRNLLRGMNPSKYVSMLNNEEITETKTDLKTDYADYVTSMNEVKENANSRALSRATTVTKKVTGFTEQTWMKQSDMPEAKYKTLVHQ